MKWEILSIEESGKYVLLIDRKTNKKLYLKPILVEKEGIRLEPLTKEECEAFGLKIEESVNESVFELKIEESAQNEDEHGKGKYTYEDNEGNTHYCTKEEYERVMRKKTSFNANSETDMEKAKILAEEQLAKLRNEPSREELRAELEDKTAKLEILAERELEKRMNELNIPEHERAYFHENPESLRAYEMAKNQKPAPNAPLNAAQLGIEGQRGFNSYEEMVLALKQAEREGNKEAKEILNQLMYKSLLGLRQRELSGQELREQPSLREITKKKHKEIK